MKRTLYLVLLLLFAYPSEAQELKVRRIKKLPIAQQAWYPAFGSNNREILLSGRNYEGLRLYNTLTRKEIVISDEKGAGYNITVNNDDIIYSVKTGRRAQMKTEYKSFNKSTGKLVSIKSYKTDGLRIKINYKQMEVGLPGEDPMIIKPVGDKRYIWASISPNQKMILFTAAGKGTYVSDLEGNIISELGYIHAPLWINNQWVVGMNDKDDGHTIISSEVFAIHFKSGKKQIISGENEGIAMYPKASIKANRIIFHNQKGEIFIAKIRMR